MNNSARRITVALGPSWQIYHPNALRGVEILGAITRPTGEVGALGRTAAGALVQINAGSIRAAPAQS